MAATQSMVQSASQAEVLPVFNSMHVVAALQSELDVLQAKILSYYHEEIVLRGDKILMREYCCYFGIEPSAKGVLKNEP